MTRPRLLLVTYHFPPSAGSAVHRAIALARYLPENGWDVSVVSPTRLATEPEDPGLLARVPRETKIIRRPYPVGLVGRAMGRFGNYNPWLPSAWRGVREAIERQRPDIIKTSGPPGAVHMLGYLAKQVYGVPWLASFRDPWVTASTVYGGSGLQRQIDLMAERRTMRHADLICLNTPTNLALLQEAYPRSADRMFFLTNGLDPSNFDAIPPQATPRPRGSGLTLLHTGSIYAGRDPRPLFTALRQIRETHPDVGPVRLKLIGRHNECGFDLPAEVHRYGVSDLVEIIEHVSYREVLAAMQQADMLVVLHTAGARGVIPAKLYEYLGTGKPILAMADANADIAWVLRLTDVTHRMAGLADPQALVDAILSMQQDLTSGTTHAASADKLRQFTRQEIAATLARRLDAFHAARQPEPSRGREGIPTATALPRSPGDRL